MTQEDVRRTSGRWTIANPRLGPPDRNTIVNMVVNVKGVVFPQPGIFLVELLLDNQWVADTTLELK